MTPAERAAEAQERKPDERPGIKIEVIEKPQPPVIPPAALELLKGPAMGSVAPGGEKEHQGIPFIALVGKGGRRGLARDAAAFSRS